MPPYVAREETVLSQGRARTRAPAGPGCFLHAIGCGASSGGHSLLPPPFPTSSNLGLLSSHPLHLCFSFSPQPSSFWQTTVCGCTQIDKQTIVCACLPSLGRSPCPRGDPTMILAHHGPYGPLLEAQAFGCPSRRESLCIPGAPIPQTARRGLLGEGGVHGRRRRSEGSSVAPAESFPLPVRRPCTPSRSVGRLLLHLRTRQASAANLEQTDGKNGPIDFGWQCVSSRPEKIAFRL